MRSRSYRLPKGFLDDGGTNRTTSYRAPIEEYEEESYPDDHLEVEEVSLPYHLCPLQERMGPLVK